MRILSLHPAATELLFAIGAGGLIVGRCDGCEYPESALTIPSIGDPQEMTIENVKVFEPTLVVLGPDQDSIARSLASLQPVVLRCASLTGAFDEMRSLASVVGKEVEADVLAHDLGIAFDRIREKVKRFHVTRVYAETRHSPPGTSALVRDLVAIAGGEAFDGEVTLDALEKFRPHAIIVCAPGEGAAYDTSLLAARDGWERLSAVRDERVFAIDDGILLRPGPRLAQGVAMLAKILHGVSANGQ